MCRLVDQGGLGIQSICNLNKVLLNKWLCKFGVDRQVLWRRLIAAKYGEESYGRFSRDPTGPLGCGVWKGISTGVKIFSTFTRFKVNNGERVLFWQDLWCASKPLRSLFPSCYALAKCKCGRMKSHMIRTRSLCY